MAAKTLIAVAVLVAVMSPLASSQSVVCAPAQVANYTGAKLVGITGSIGWIYSYYNFSGFSTAQVIHPDAINYTSGAKPGSAYLVYSDYKFDGPGGLSSNPVIVMILANNTQQGCSSMKLFAYSGIVMPYKQAALLSAQQASIAAQKAGYNVTFGQPLTLVPESNSTGIQVLVPGYSFQGSNYTIYSNAENGTVSGTPNAHVGAAQGGAGGLSGVGSSLSGVYNLFVGIWDWISQLLGGLTAVK